MAVKKTTKKTAKKTTAKAKVVKAEVVKAAETTEAKSEPVVEPVAVPKEPKRSSFIKLTRQDGQPIWINASFIITIEPRKGGGSIVVPIGDGLDYDVRNSPEAVIAMADGAPIPDVVPVPTKDMMPRPKREGEAAEAPTPATDGAAQNVTSRMSYAGTPLPLLTGDEGDPERKMKPMPPAVLDLTDEQVDQLKKMSPRSVRKVLNTLDKHFKVPDAATTMRALEEHGIMGVDSQGHVSWMSVLNVEAEAKAEEAKSEEKAENEDK